MLKKSHLTLEQIANYSDLELLSFVLSTPKDHVSSKDLQEQLGESNLANLLMFNSDHTVAEESTNSNAILGLKLMLDIWSRLYLPKVPGVNKSASEIHILASWNEIVNYCKFMVGFKKKEIFLIFLINSKGLIIQDAILETGTIDKVSVYPREIADLALAKQAQEVLLVHNHPSGDPRPSKEDIIMTKAIKAALKFAACSIHDHLIVSANQYFSFKDNLLLSIEDE